MASSLKKHVAILPCRGIGDSLLLTILAHRLTEAGYVVTLVHPDIGELSSWFPHLLFAKEISLSSMDWIIVENDNSSFISSLKKTYPESLTILYPTYSKAKHGPLSPLDRVCNPSLSMAENMGIIAASFLSSSNTSSDNGITPLEGLVFRKYPRRILLHTTSSEEKKNWPLPYFQHICQALKKRGYDPVFVPKFPSLSSLAAYIYESGFVIGNDSLVCHLASNLGLSTLVIADCQKRMALWRPGWKKGDVIALPSYLSSFHLLKKNWKYCIRPWYVLKEFDRIINESL